MYYTILKQAKKLYRIGSDIKKNIDPNVKTLHKSRKLKVAGTPYRHITNSGYHFGGVLTIDTSVGYIDAEQDTMMFDAWHTDDTIMEEIWEKYNLLSPLLGRSPNAYPDFVLYRPFSSPFSHSIPSPNTNLPSAVFSPSVPPALVPALNPQDVRSNTVRTLPSFFRASSSTSPATNQNIPSPGRNRAVASPATNVSIPSTGRNRAIASPGRNRVIASPVTNQSVPSPGRNRAIPRLAVNIQRPVVLDPGTIKRRNTIRRARNLQRWITDFTLCLTAYQRGILRTFKNVQRTVPMMTVYQKQGILSFCRTTRNQRQVGAFGPAKNMRKRLSSIHRDRITGIITSTRHTKIMRREKSGVKPARKSRT